MISEAQSITKLMAFDYYLLKRSKISLEKDILRCICCIEANGR